MTPRPRRLAWVGAAILIPWAGAAPIDFNSDILPVLSDACFHCHGPDGESRKGGLRLDRPENVFADRDNGSVIVRGRPDDSMLIARLFSDDADEVMPPPDSNKSITDAEKQLLVEWVKQGAAWQEHWAFVPPIKPTPPDLGQHTHPIDAFVAARWEERDLSPSPRTDKRTLIRRIHLAITGLPPSPEAVAAFVADERPRAFPEVVDRLLATPQFGEHMARYWLDAARYGDTHGLHYDNLRIMWPYRDWVVDAFNANQPFDEFTVEQIAGDLLPEPSLDQQIATGFHRCLVTTAEDGIIQEEFRLRYGVDRTHTTGRVWLGLTLECASCHDHKYDPISMRDFYGLFAFFDNTTMPIRGDNRDDTPPVISVPRDVDRERYLALQHTLQDLEVSLSQQRQALDRRLQTWNAERELLPAPVPSQALPTPVFHASLAEGRGGTLWDRAGKRRLDLRGDPASAWVYTPSQPAAVALALNGSQFLAADQVGDFESTDPFSWGGWIYSRDGQGQGPILARMNQYPVYRGWDLHLDQNKIRVHLVHRWPHNALRGTIPFPANRWTHVFMTYDGSSTGAGLTAWVNGESVPLDVSHDHLDGSIRIDAPLQIGRRLSAKPTTGTMVRDLRLYRGVLSKAAIRTVMNDHLMPQLLATRDHSPEDAPAVATWFSARHALPAALRIKSDAERLPALESELAAIRKRGTTTMVMAEKAGTEPMTHIRIRGAYNAPGEEVGPGIPEVFGRLDGQLPRNRLGLARWLVDPANPLTARVTVNRLWQQFFGYGIVATAGDFGLQGARPTHPELLDWLAVDFVEHGWDVKRFVRQLVLTETWQRSSEASPGILTIDPDNQWLARGGRFRLDAEVIRDQVLATSGLLVNDRGGASVKPYQPDGEWQAVAHPASNTRVYRRDDGDNLYRRSLYTFWKRTAPPTQLAVFDAPSRETCTVTRERTNTPLQALALMNDVQYVEAARHLAGEILAGGAADDTSRLRALAVRVLARPFDDAESRILERSLQLFRERYRADPDLARRFIRVGDSAPPKDQSPAELAAWTLVASQVLNLNEFITLH